MKYGFIRGAVIIVLTVIYIIIMVIKADRDLSLDDGFLFATVLMAGDSLSKVCVCTSMFRKNMGKGLKKALIILVAIVCFPLVLYSIYCMIVNRSISWVGCDIAFVSVIATYIMFHRELGEMMKINLDGKNIEDM